MMSIGAGGGNRTLVFSLEVNNFPQCFQQPFRHFAAVRAIEITTEFLFVGMATSPMRVLFKPFDGGKYRGTVIILGAYGNP